MMLPIVGIVAVGVLAWRHRIMAARVEMYKEIASAAVTNNVKLTMDKLCLEKQLQQARAQTWFGGERRMVN